METTRITNAIGGTNIAKVINFLPMSIFFGEMLWCHVQNVVFFKAIGRVGLHTGHGGALVI